MFSMGGSKQRQSVTSSEAEPRTAIARLLEERPPLLVIFPGLQHTYGVELYCLFTCVTFSYSAKYGFLRSLLFVYSSVQYYTRLRDMQVLWCAVCCVCCFVALFQQHSSRRVLESGDTVSPTLSNCLAQQHTSTETQKQPTTRKEEEEEQQQDNNNNNKTTRQ